MHHGVPCIHCAKNASAKVSSRKRRWLTTSLRGQCAVLMGSMIHPICRAYVRHATTPKDSAIRLRYQHGDACTRSRRGGGSESLGGIRARPRPPFLRTMSKFREFWKHGKTASQALLRGVRYKSDCTWEEERTIRMRNS